MYGKGSTNSKRGLSKHEQNEKSEVLKGYRDHLALSKTHTKNSQSIMSVDSNMPANAKKPARTMQNNPRLLEVMMKKANGPGNLKSIKGESEGNKNIDIKIDQPHKLSNAENSEFNEDGTQSVNSLATPRKTENSTRQAVRTGNYFDSGTTNQPQRDYASQETQPQAMPLKQLLFPEDLLPESTVISNEKKLNSAAWKIIRPLSAQKFFKGSNNKEKKNRPATSNVRANADLMFDDSDAKAEGTIQNKNDERNSLKVTTVCPFVYDDDFENIEDKDKDDILSGMQSNPPSSSLRAKPSSAAVRIYKSQTAKELAKLASGQLTQSTSDMLTERMFQQQQKSALNTIGSALQQTTKDKNGKINVNDFLRKSAATDANYDQKVKSITTVSSWLDATSKVSQQAKIAKMFSPATNMKKEAEKTKNEGGMEEVKALLTSYIKNNPKNANLFRNIKSAQQKGRGLLKSIDNTQKTVIQSADEFSEKKDKYEKTSSIGYTKLQPHLLKQYKKQIATKTDNDDIKPNSFFSSSESGPQHFTIQTTLLDQDNFTETGTPKNDFIPPSLLTNIKSDKERLTKILQDKRNKNKKFSKKFEIEAGDDAQFNMHPWVSNEGDGGLGNSDIENYNDD